MAISRTSIRTIKVLDLIAKSARGISLSEVSNHLNIPKTSANDIIKALVDTEMVEILNERSMLYGVGVKAYYIGNAYLTNSSFIDKARSVIDQVGSKINKTIFLGIPVSGEITYIYKYEPQNPLVATCKIGDRIDLHCTSLGKSILAYDESLLSSLEGKKLTQNTEYTKTEYMQILEEVRAVKEKGYAIDLREQNAYLACVGAPIFDHNGQVIAAISATGFYDEGRDLEAEGKIMSIAAAKISKTLGYY